MTVSHLNLLLAVIPPNNSRNMLLKFFVSIHSHTESTYHDLSLFYTEHLPRSMYISFFWPIELSLTYHKISLHFTILFLSHNLYCTIWGVNDLIPAFLLHCFLLFSCLCLLLIRFNCSTRSLKMQMGNRGYSKPVLSSKPSIQGAWHERLELISLEMSVSHHK